MISDIILVIKNYNDQRYYISNQKLRDLGWNIIIGFEEGISKLI